MESNRSAQGAETTSADYSGTGPSRDFEQNRSPGDDVRSQARRVAEEQKSRAADSIGGFAHAAESAASDLNRQAPQAANALHAIAERLDSAAASLRERGVDDLMRSMGGFAREQPATFFAGAVLAGFALSRFLKSSTEQR